jgi:hypothetical protein
MKGTLNQQTIEPIFKQQSFLSLHINLKNKNAKLFYLFFRY